MQQNGFHFFIIERDRFIASDLRAGLNEASPGATFHVFDSLHDLAAAADLPGAASGPVALITKATLAELDESGLSQRARHQGWNVVLRLGSDPVEQVEARGYLSLAAPFTHEDLVWLAGRLRQNILPQDRRSA